MGIQAIELDHKRYSGISFRGGGASLAAQEGTEKELIIEKELGDWKSDAYELYCRDQLSKGWSYPHCLPNYQARLLVCIP